jgi:PPP family 3-phenylpropionic acid transporter
MAFLTIGVFMPFWPLWLEKRGLGPEEIGLLLGLATASKVFGSPFFANLSDRLGSRRRLMIGVALGSLAAFVFYSSANSLAMLILGAIFTGLTFPALLPLGENTTLMAARLKSFEYGRVRLWGSLTFIGASWGGGLWVASAGVASIPWLVIGGMTLLVISCVMLPDIRVPRAAQGWRSFRGLLGNRIFLLFMLSTGLIQCSHAAYYGFSTLHWRAEGLSESMIGLLWGVSVGAEVALFMFSGAIVKHLGIMRLLVVAALVGILRWSLTAAGSELWLLLPTQALHAATFGATHLAAMHFIQRAVPETVSATAQGLYSAVVMGLMLALTMWATGALYGAFGGGAFLVMAGMSGAGLLVTFFLTRLWRGELLDI